MLVVRRLALGVLIVTPAIILEREFEGVLAIDRMSPPLAEQTKAFLMYGLTEELLRFIAIDHVVRQDRGTKNTVVMLQARGFRSDLRLLKMPHTYFRYPTAPQSRWEFSDLCCLL